MSGVVIRVLGGVGNQMYCLAFAIFIRKEFNSSVMLDTTSAYLFDGFNRNYCLDKIFKNNVTEKAKKIDILVGYVKRIFIKLGLGASVSYVREKDDWLTALNKAVELNRDIHLEGYWQDIVYCNGIVEEMLDNYSPPLLDPNLQKIARDLSLGAASLTHIRVRGIDNPTGDEYFVSPEYQDFLKACPVNYYISDSNSTIPYLDKQGLLKISANGEDSHLKEFELLRMAKVKCLANSTFSQWAEKMSADNISVLWQKIS